MKRFFKLIIAAFLLSVIFIFAFLNQKLYYQPSTQIVNGRSVDMDVLHQLYFLRDALHQGAATDMQQIYPEGFVLMHVLYGLTWSDWAATLPPNSSLAKQAVQEVTWAYDQIDSEAGKSIFDASLQPSYGAFYAGWRNYLLGKKLSLQPSRQRLPADIQNFTAQCNDIASAIANHASPFPASYDRAAWPADGVIGVASLSLHDKILPPRYRATIQHWLSGIVTRLDTATGLIPHAVDSTGAALEGARGSSQSLIHSFLPEIDSAFAAQQFKQYKKQFLTTRLGLPAIREYPPGKEGSGDIDAGPILFQIGGAATLVGVRAMQKNGDEATAQAIRQCIEAFGLPTQPGNSKQYLFGQLPMADAFIAWTDVAIPAQIAHPQPYEFNLHWRLLFQFLSLLVVAACLFPLVKTIR